MRGTALDINQLVGKNYLLLLHIMEDTAPDNGSDLQSEIYMSHKAFHQKQPLFIDHMLINLSESEVAKVTCWALSGLWQFLVVWLLTSCVIP